MNPVEAVPEDEIPGGCLDDLELEEVCNVEPQADAAMGRRLTALCCFHPSPVVTS